MYGITTLIFAFLIFILPLGLYPMPLLHLEGDTLKTIYIFVMPLLIFAHFIFVPGFLSLPFHKGIKRGKFEHSVKNKKYMLRKIYGFLWTSIYYFKPLYWLMLSLKPLKIIVFRLFGYKGNLNFDIYPDTWIRDLPILDFGRGTYLSNRATIGSNMVLSDGSVLVDGIRTGERSLIGHLAVLAAGTKVGNSTDIGVECTLGIRARVGNNSLIQPKCSLNHGAVIGDSCKVGTCSFIGLRSVIRDNIKIPPGTHIKDGQIINSQQDLDKILEEEVNQLLSKKSLLVEMLLKHSKHLEEGEFSEEQVIPKSFK